MARPVVYTKRKRQAILTAFYDYIEENDIPVVLEFAYKNKLRRQSLYEWPEFKDAVELCVMKKEANLEIFGLTKQIDITMAIFSLKQLGWKDKQEVEHTGKDGAPLPISFTFVANTSDDRTSSK